MSYTNRLKLIQMREYHESRRPARYLVRRASLRKQIFGQVARPGAGPRLAWFSSRLASASAEASVMALRWASRLRLSFAFAPSLDKHGRGDPAASEALDECEDLG